MDKLFTIVVPSYNRNNNLKKTIEELYPQLLDHKENVSLIIIDNCSQHSYEKDLANNSDFLRLVSEGVAKIITNPFNVGMSANILRCFEHVTTEWMLMLSDDDMIKPSLVHTILGEIAGPNISNAVSIIKFRSKYLPLQDCRGRITNVYEFINYLSKSSDHFNSFLFLSNSLYRVSDFKNYVQMGYVYAKSYAPHLIIQLFAIYNTSSEITLSEQIIVEYKRPEVGYNYGLVAGLGVGCFKEFDFSINDNAYKKLISCFYPHSDCKVIVDLFYYTRSKSKKRFARLAREYIHLVRCHRSLIKVVSLRGLLILGLYPRLFEFMLTLACRLNKNLNNHAAEIKVRYNYAEKNR